MYSDRTKTRVGAVTLVFLVGAMIVVLSLGGVELRSTIGLEVEFGHVGALDVGADVQIAGRVVGRVSGISLTETGAIAHIRLEERYIPWAPRNAEVFVASKGLLSQRYLEIGPPAGGEPPAQPVAAGDRLHGIAPVRVEMVVLRSIENTKRFRDLLDELSPEASRLADELDALGTTLGEIEGRPDRYSRLAASARRLMKSVETTRGLLDDAGVFDGRIGRLQARIDRVSDQLDLELSALRADLRLLVADLERIGKLGAAGSLEKLEVAAARAGVLVAQFQQTAAAASELWARIERGEGTVGGLLHDPEFIDEAKQLGRIIKRQPWKLIGTSRKESPPE